MAASGKALWALALAGALAFVGIGVAYLAPPAPPPIREAQPILAPPQEADLHVPSACRTATASVPDCTAAWEARHRHFFDEAPSSSGKEASSEGGRP